MIDILTFKVFKCKKYCKIFPERANENDLNEMYVLYNCWI